MFSSNKNSCIPLPDTISILEKKDFNEHFNQLLMNHNFSLNKIKGSQKKVLKDYG